MVDFAMDVYRSLFAEKEIPHSKWWCCSVAYPGFSRAETYTTLHTSFKIDLSVNLVLQPFLVLGYWLLVYSVVASNDFLSLSCVSAEGEEVRGCGPAKAAAVRDRTHCEDVWRSWDNKADAVNQVESVISYSKHILQLYLITVPKQILCQTWGVCKIYWLLG